MASRMVCYEISVNGKLLSKASVSECDQLEAALAKLVGEREPILNFTVFSPSARYPNKHISWQTDQIDVGDELLIRIVEDDGSSDATIKTIEDLNAEVVSKCFCSFCGKGDREVPSMIAGKDGVFICNECVELCVDINTPIKKLER